MGWACLLGHKLRLQCKISYIYIYARMDSCVEEDTDLRSTNMATQRLLSLEREKRIAAERLVEKERQALLQLRNLLSCKGIEINNKYQKEDNPTTESSSKEPLQRSVSNTSVGFMTRAFSQEFSSSVFNDLPGELQQSLALNHIGKYVCACVDHNVVYDVCSKRKVKRLF